MTDRVDESPRRSLAGRTVLQAVPAMRDDAVGRATLNLASALLRSGARSLVAGSGGPLVGELQALGGEWMEFDFASASPLRRRRNARALRDLIAAERVDLVHAQTVDTAQTAAKAVRRRTALVTTYSGSPPAPSWRPQPQDAMARGGMVIAYSSFAADLIAARHKIPRERVIVIPCSVDTAWFDPVELAPERVTALRKAWRIAPQERVVLAPGRLIAAHGHLTLVDAVRLLVNGGMRDVTFVIAGNALPDESYAAALAQRIAAQGLERIFRRVGHCADMPAVYALADIVVLPTERATIFSAMAAEAQMMGRPVIASALGALPELLLAPSPEDGGHRTGWLAQPRDVFDLARMLASALALDERGWQMVAARAYRLAEASFSPAQVAAATLAAYGALLDNSA
jgi:glycosyltransferase involved in cell wall biosynthesis